MASVFAEIREFFRIQFTAAEQAAEVDAALFVNEVSAQ
ncbi:hypothetical protein FHX62_004056 [Cupriavidus alkaliphilus]|nr:hypothetical protein [Cupriavidus alkaliphilus]